MSDEKTAAFFDDVARGGAMESFDEAQEAKVARALKRWDLRLGQRVLEPGCGAGRLTGRLAEAVGVSGEVFAFDVSKEMVKRARARGLPRNVQVVVASTASIPAPGFLFDHAIVLEAWPHFADRKAALEELARTVKPGGRLWIEHFACRGAVNAFHAEHHADVADHQLPDPDTLRAELGAGGFQVLRVEDGEDGFFIEARRKGL